MFEDPAVKAAFATIVSTILVQLLGHFGLALDPASANAISGSIVVIGLGLIGKHAVVEHAETHAEAHVEAAKVTAAAGQATAGPTS